MGRYGRRIVRHPAWIFFVVLTGATASVAVGWFAFNLATHGSTEYTLTGFFGSLVLVPLAIVTVRAGIFISDSAVTAIDRSGKCVIPWNAVKSFRADGVEFRLGQFGSIEAERVDGTTTTLISVDFGIAKKQLVPTAALLNDELAARHPTS